MNFPQRPGVFRLTILGCLLFSSANAFAQLEAPGALSSFSGCKHHTCTWVPNAGSQSFKRGEFTYQVDTVEDKDGGVFVLTRAGREIWKANLQDLSASVSAVWSPDERSFAVTWSDGGAIGGFHVRVFHIEGDAVTEWPSTHTAFSTFKARHWCAARGDNIQAYRWSEDSKKLLLVLSVYPTSDCGTQLGHTEAYLVEAATGRIEENWTLPRLKAYMRSHPEL